MYFSMRKELLLRKSQTYGLSGLLFSGSQKVPKAPLSQATLIFPTEKQPYRAAFAKQKSWHGWGLTPQTPLGLLGVTLNSLYADCALHSRLRI